MFNKEQLDIWRTRVDALNFRERTLLLFTVIIVTYGLFDWLFLSSLHLSMRQKETELNEWQAKLAIVEQQSRDLYEAGLDPIAARRAELDELNQTLAAQTARIEQRMGNLLDSQEAPALLRDLLAQQNGLTLSRLQTGQQTFMPKGAGSDATAGLARYEIDLTLQGSYLSLLHFVDRMEQSDWQLFWDQLSLRVGDHPASEIQLKLYTLGTGS